MKNTLLIVYNGGAYGTYLEWVLRTLLSLGDIVSPFTSLGNSHAAKGGKHLGDFEGFQKYIESSDNFVTARLHPKTKSTDSIQANMDFFLDYATHVILLYPDRSHELMAVCNYMTKIWSGDTYDGAMAYMAPEDIYKNYDIASGTDLRSIPAWIRREHMSFNLFDSWHDQVEWYLPDQWHDARAMIITTKELFEDFENMLVRIQDFWGKSYQRSISDMLPWHHRMLALQPHTGKDQLCADILNSVLDDHGDQQEFGDICMVSQALVQYQLRMQGYELRCDGLNEFPTDTHTLKSFIYRS